MDIITPPRQNKTGKLGSPRWPVMTKFRHPSHNTRKTGHETRITKERKVPQYRRNIDRDPTGATRNYQQDISPQLEALQAQISALQAQLTQHFQRGTHYQQPVALDPLTVVGQWQHTGQQAIGSTQLMGHPPGNQGNTHHIQPTATTTGRNSVELNTSIPPPYDTHTLK